MADRDVKVTLQAVVADYVSKMRQARQSTEEVGGAGSETAKKLAQQREAMETVGKAGVAFGTILAAGVALAVAKFAEFDSAMSSVQAATLESSENMGLLRDAAIDAGASTVFSATESANAIEELAKAGISTSDILEGALAGSLDLAAAGQLGVARAAEITSTALNQFSLRGDRASHVADVLAAGAGKAMGSVEDLANGLKFVGPVAASMGVSLEETTGVLALFAQQGIIGEQAGTSLRGVLASLTSPSSQARKEIERLGITLYDNQGKFLGLENAAGQLSNAYTKMDGASRDASLGIIFGRETVTAATALYRAGSKGVDEWTQAVDDSGFAAEQARLRLDNLKGDLEALSGALDSALIETGSAANETLRAMVQALTGLVDLYNDLPAPIQGTVLAIGGATAAVTLAGGAALLAVPKWLEMKAVVDKAGLSMGGIGLKAGAAGLALGGLFLVVGELARAQAEARQRAESYATTLEEGTNKITRATQEMAVANLSASKEVLWWTQDSALDNARTLGIATDTVTQATLGNVDALKELNAALKLNGGNMFEQEARAKELGISVIDLQIATGQLKESVRGESSSLEESIRVNQQKKEATDALAGATGDSADASQTAAAAYIAEADAVRETGNELTRLIDTINQANGTGQDAITSNIAYQDALAKVDEQIQKVREGQEGYSATLDTGTAAGRDNMSMLVDLANRANDAAQKQFALDNNTANYKATLDAGRQALIDRATQLGMNADEASALADQIYRIPSSTEWEAIAKTAAANTEIARFIADQESKVIRIGISTFYKDGPQGQVRISTPGAPDKFAEGGAVRGPGSATSDSIVARLSNGEHVLPADEVAKLGGQGAVYAMRRAIMSGQMGKVPGFANGGAVGRVHPQYASSFPRPIVNVAAPSTQFPSQLVLEVDGRQFTAYVKGAAGEVVRDTFSGYQGGVR